jgi:hypothetical protein
MREPLSKEGFHILPLVACAGVLWADLASPLTQTEYAQVMVQQAVWHEPLSDQARDHNLAEDRDLACLLREDMTKPEVYRVLGVRPSFWVRARGSWEDYYALLGLAVRYRVAEVGPAGKGRLELVVEGVQATPL